MINAYQSDTVVLKSKQPADKWNNITYIDTSVICRVERVTKLVKNLQGEDVKSEATIYFDSTLAINYGDKIILDSIEYAIILISNKKAFSLCHKEVNLNVND